MIWVDIALTVAFGLLSIGPFAWAEDSANEGNLAGVVWHGLWFFLMAAFAYGNGRDVAQYMGWI